jgi:hypothetical protein
MPKKKKRGANGWSTKRNMERSKRQQLSGNTQDDPVLVDIDAVEEEKDEEVIADEVEEVNEEKGDQDEVIDEGDDYTDDGTGSDDEPPAPYSTAELIAFAGMISTCGSNLVNYRKLGRRMKDTFHKEGQDEWSVWDAAREEGDTVLEVMTKMHGTQTKKMRAVVSDLSKLEQSAIESFEATFHLLAKKPIFSAGKVMAELQLQAVTDGERIIELEDELAALKHSNSGMKAMLWQYESIFKQTDNLTKE